jgi:uncharacterized protein (TIGR00661 family)
MKILYAIQGTGNGHLSRARDIIPVLMKDNHVDILISGTQADVELPFPVKYKYMGLGFIFGDKGGIDLKKTYRKNNLRRFFYEIDTLPVELYDLVINDFEPVSAWACELKNVKCISLSHQVAVLNKFAPQPSDTDLLGKAILKNYAPTSREYGFHFKAYDKGIFTPVIRKQIRELEVRNLGHYTVYLPAYDDKRIIDVLQEFEYVNWQVFSKHNKKRFRENNIAIEPINNESFINSMASSTGVLCGAGFETPAEALFMNKKLMVIPMKGQYEQQCNAAALADMGVPVIKSLKMKFAMEIAEWLQSDTRIIVDYPDITEQIVNDVIYENTPDMNIEMMLEGRKPDTLKKFKRMLLKKISSELQD